MHMMGWKTWRHGDPHAQNYAVCSDDLARINMIYHFYVPCYVEYSSINKMAKYDWNTFRNYFAFLAGGVAPGTRRPHHDSELISCYHEAFRTWGHYHNNIVLFNHDSLITRSHFMDPTDRAIKGFYCIYIYIYIYQTFYTSNPQLSFRWAARIAKWWSIHHKRWPQTWDAVWTPVYFMK